MLNPNSYDQELIKTVHPENWENPVPSGAYNLLVIGGGTAGLVSAVGAANLGAKVALVEKDLLGGDCLNVGCVPSKGVISSARIAQTIKDSGDYGIKEIDETEVDFPKVMDRMRKLRAKISKHDAASRLKSLSIDVFFGEAKFIGADVINIGGTKLKFKKAVIATGARALVPPIDGIKSVDYLTNETIFDLTELPESIGIVGAGPIGCEMAQTFSSLGAKTYLIESKSSILSNYDEDVAWVVQKNLEKSGVEIICSAKELRISHGEQINLELKQNDKSIERKISKLLIAVGRTPNVEALSLEKGGIKYNEKGIVVDEYLRTSNKHVYAAGDICSRYKFTHAADFMARHVIQNALFFGRKKMSDLIIPWCTYTSPEASHVGLTEFQAAERNIEIDIYKKKFSAIDRAILEGEEDGFVKILTKRGCDKILGATVVAKNAGDLISTITMAMVNNIGLSKIASVIHPYPTQAEAIRIIGDDYNSKRLTSFIKKLTTAWFNFLRKI